MESDLATDPDRLLPSEEKTRSIARDLLARVEDLPIISPHGHVEVATLSENEPFPDPATLLVSGDHYLTRLIHSSGVSLGSLGLGTEPHDPREVWREFMRAWPLFSGTASEYWLRSELVNVLHLDVDLTAETSDEVYDLLVARLAEPDFRPRSLFEQFGIEVLATTDDPLDDLGHHAALRSDETFTSRVIPTFRPDAYLDVTSPGWVDRVDRLIAEAGEGLVGYRGYHAALLNRRRHFIENGAVSADHGVRNPITVKLGPVEAQALFDRARTGNLDPFDQERFLAHMLYEMARMSVEDGLVMTVHAGVLRNHHSPTFARFGPDTGHDIPIATSFAEGLRPLLQDWGTEPGFHLVLFTVDESAWSRELAPLAGFYPSVYLGAPWWFLDAPDAIRRFREAVTETAGYSRSSGFIDDTRAFLSIPARHDAARRAEAGYLARLVAEKRVALARAEQVIVDIVSEAPRRVFKL